MAIMVGTGRGAHAGVLIKNAEALETMEKVDTIVFDKTGTLTEGKPHVVGVSAAEILPGIAGDALMRLAASLESASEHPLAAAIVAKAKELNLSLSEPASFQAQPGLGVRGRVEGKNIAIGNRALMHAVGAFESNTAISVLKYLGATVIYVAIDGRYAGYIAVADPVKQSTPAALGKLKAQGLRLLMLTGDNQFTAREIARSLGIEDVQG